LDRICYTEIAIEKRDARICDKAASTYRLLTKPLVKYSCYVDVAVATENNSVCELITDEDWASLKKRCLDSFLQ